MGEPTVAVLRERIAEAILRAGDGESVGPHAAADALLPVVARYCEQLEAGRETWKAKAAEIEQERDELLAELGGRDEEARERWIQKQLDETGIRAMDFRNGMEMELKPARELLAYQVAAARTMLGDAPNYTETKMSWDVKVAESPEMYTIVIQRHAPGALTPHEARQKAEARAAELETAVARVRALADMWFAFDAHRDRATELHAALDGTGDAS